MNQNYNSKEKKISQEQVIMKFFENNPNRDIHHPEVVDWATNFYENKYNTKFRDPDRAIRKLHQSGKLIKISKGIYSYNPELVKNNKISDFTAKQKAEIFKRDDYKCVKCGMGKREGEELHVDHVKPRDKGGLSTNENGQTLCAKHNFLKKNLGMTETGKKMFLRILESSKENNEIELQKFCEDVLAQYEKHNMNGHIVWKK